MRAVHGLCDNVRAPHRRHRHHRRRRSLVDAVTRVPAAGKGCRCGVGDGAAAERHGPRSASERERGVAMGRGECQQRCRAAVKVVYVDVCSRGDERARVFSQGGVRVGTGWGWLMPGMVDRDAGDIGAER